MNLLNSDSFEPSTSAALGLSGYAITLENSGCTFGTAEITLGRETRRLPCFKQSNGLLSAPGWLTGVSGRYRTGMKRWPALIHHMRTADGVREVVMFGRDDHCGQQKTTLSF